MSNVPKVLHSECVGYGLGILRKRKDVLTVLSRLEVYQGMGSTAVLTVDKSHSTLYSKLVNELLGVERAICVKASV